MRITRSIVCAAATLLFGPASATAQSAGSAIADSADTARTGWRRAGVALRSRDLPANVDVFTPMLGADGRPLPELYQADSLHMAEAGYALWRARLAPFIH